MTRRPDERTPPDHNPDWYRIRYQLAALHMNRATDQIRASAPEGTDQDTPKKLALEQAKGLATETAKNIEGFPPDDRHLVEFLQTTIEPSLLVLLAGALLFDATAQERPSERVQAPTTRHELIDVLDGERVNPWALVDYVQQDNDLAPRVLYNLACFYARAAATAETEEWMREALHRDPRIDPLSEAAKWLTRAVRQTPISERRAVFNLIHTDPALKDLGMQEKLMEVIHTLEGEPRRATNKPNHNIF